VSVMSASGAPIEQIARLVGHSTDQSAIRGPELLDAILKPPRKVRRGTRTAANADQRTWK
jgi:hypothetical protein